MKFMKHISVENSKGDFNFVFYMQEGASWVSAKEASREIYEQIVALEAQSIAASQASAPAEESASDVTAELSEA